MFYLEEGAFIMKKWSWMPFIVGIIIGSLLTIGTVFYLGHKAITNSGTDEITGLTMLKENEKGSTFDTKSIKVMQTLSPKMALAHTGKESSYTHKIEYYDGILVLYKAPDNARLYDDQIIEIPAGKSLVQIGTFEYETKNKTMKTVPAVSIK